METLKNFFACKIVLAAKHHYPENIQRLFACKVVLDANHHYPEFIRRLFRLQNCLRRISWLSWKNSKNFRLQNCVSRKSSLSWKDSKIFLVAKLSQPQIIIILKLFKDLFACKIVLAANHQNPGSIQRLFRLQNCLRRRSWLSWKYSKNFRLQNCLSRKSSLSWKHWKTFSLANLSQPQIIIILKLFKDLFACKIVLPANHQNLGNIRRLFRLQNCLSRKSSLSWKHWKTFSLATLS